MKPETYAKAFITSLKDNKMSDVLPRLKKMLAGKGETHLLPRILKNAIAILEREDKTVVSSRHPLDAASKKRVIAVLEKRFGVVDEKEIDFETDEKILGGVSIAKKDFLYDATVRKQIQNIK